MNKEQQAKYLSSLDGGSDTLVEVIKDSTGDIVGCYDVGGLERHKNDSWFNYFKPPFTKHTMTNHNYWKWKFGLVEI